MIEKNTYNRYITQVPCKILFIWKITVIKKKNWENYYLTDFLINLNIQEKDISATEWIINDNLASLIALAITDFVVTEVLLASHILYRDFISDEKLCAMRYQGVKDARTRECQFEDELRPRRDWRGCH